MGELQSPVRSQFTTLRWKLLLAFLTVISLALGAETLSIYRNVSRSLYDQVDQETLNLAEAAAYALKDGQVDRTKANILVAAGNQNLELPGNPRKQRLGIEWFDAQGQRLYQVGRTIPNIRLTHHLERQRVANSWVLTVEVEPEDNPDSLQGYVRVAVDLAPTTRELERLKHGIIEGSAVALVICGVGSWWLMRLAMTPIEQGFERLRQFTADASHELRGPLTAIQTSMTVVQSHPERLHPSDLEKVELTVSATRQMARLVEDLLLLSRLDSSATQNTATLLPLDELLEDLSDLYTMRLGDQPLTLITSLKAGAMVKGDPNQLKRLFSNLLENAVKYTPAPGQIRLSSQRQENSVVVTIADTGIGIAPDNLTHIYDRFWRADEARSHQHGSGLGLAIVRGIVQAHQGSIAITSTLHQGTTAQITLPLAKPQA